PYATLCRSRLCLLGGHVAGGRGAGTQAVPEEDGALGRGGGRFEEFQVGGRLAAVEDLLADAEHDRIDPQVELVEEAFAQQGPQQVQAAVHADVVVLVAQVADGGGEVGAQLGGARPGQVRVAA